jgi:hypothetical protein
VLTGQLEQEMVELSPNGEPVAESCCCQSSGSVAGGFSSFLQLREFQEGDRRGSNPRSSEPQSADSCFSALPGVAEIACLSLYLC